MKAVMMSIQPKWCELIASGKKTVEVRKTRPKLETPFKVYIYCTKGEYLWKDKDRVFSDGKYNRIIDNLPERLLNGKIIGEFVCKAILPISITYSDPNSKVALRAFPFTCLTDKEIMDYLGNGKEGYGWCISDLVIYDKPKELNEFCVTDNSAIQSCKHREITGQPEYKTAHNGWIKGSYICNVNGEPDWCTKCKVKPITRPPQSWCYVEELV